MKSKLWPIAVLAISLSVLFGLVGYVLHTRHAAESTLVTEVTTQNFEDQVMKSPIPVFVEFYTKKQKCVPCEKEAPIVEKLAAEYAGKVHFVRIDVLDNQEIAVAAGIKGVPTHVLLNPSVGTAVGAAGYLDEANLHALIEQGLTAKAPANGGGAPDGNAPNAKPQPDPTKNAPAKP
jgi:thioredoxin 1